MKFPITEASDAVADVSMAAAAAPNFFKYIAFFMIS